MMGDRASLRASQWTLSRYLEAHVDTAPDARRCLLQSLLRDVSAQHAKSLRDELQRAVVDVTAERDAEEQTVDASKVNVYALGLRVADRLDDACALSPMSRARKWLTEAAAIDASAHSARAEARDVACLCAYRLASRRVDRSAYRRVRTRIRRSRRRRDAIAPTDATEPWRDLILDRVVLLRGRPPCFWHQLQTEQLSTIEKRATCYKLRRVYGHIPASVREQLRRIELELYALDRRNVSAAHSSLAPHMVRVGHFRRCATQRRSVGAPSPLRV